MNKKIIHTALENFEERIGIRGTFKPNHDFGGDGILTLCFQKKENKFLVHTKREYRMHQLVEFDDKKENNFADVPYLFVAERLFPKIKEELRKRDINWMDVHGNAYVKTDNQIIWIDIGREQTTKRKKKRAFTKTGLKVVFLLLEDENWLNRTHREIAEEANVALGTITYVLEGLKEHNFLSPVDNNTWKLKRKRELFDQWIAMYQDTLLPKIELGRFTFGDPDKQNKWQEWELGEDTVWGGEPAADILTHNYKLGEFILYTKLPKPEIMKNFQLIPRDDGNVILREPFWNLNKREDRTAPPLAVYADLVTTNEPRNLNIAQEIYERFLKNFA